MPDTRFFDRSGPFSLSQLAEIGKARINEPLPPSLKLESLFYDVAPLEDAIENTVGVLHNSKYLKNLKFSRAGVCILEDKHIESAPQTAAILVTNTPYRSYALIAQAFYPEAFSCSYAANQETHIHPSANIGYNSKLEPGVIIAANVRIGVNTTIAANSVIGQGVVIGDNCQIGANVSISHSLIGNQVTIHAGTRMGQAGFGFFMDEAGHVQVPQLGRVLIEDRVEIGANVTIDRGSAHDTVIGAGTRIDNLVHIAHNVRLGKGCVIVAQVGISGSTNVGDFTAIAGQAGLTGHLKIGKGVRIAAQSGVMRDITEGMTVGGSPAVPVSQWHRQTIALQKLISKKERA
ncbi:MAG: UDP-3-O-(3-hydroxymyristoyl)glucosamine N-acyltransferase [Alphaproteobacteria bacterium]|nr:UDP-3-O-(3-hydroxymyristoyl)glucosamine N-acyltransferase [Alphaproteobacteria bacterium]